MPYTIPPDTRAIGTGNPPVDMNDVADVLTGSGLNYNILNTAFAGGAAPTGTNSSSAAIQAAINAAMNVAVPQFDNGPMLAPAVIIPVGNYLITTPLTFSGYSKAGIRITGTSRGSRLFSTGSTIFDFQTVYLQGFEFDHLTIDATGGHCFTNAQLKFCWFHDLDLVQNSPNYSIWNQTQANSSLQNTVFADIRFWVYPDSSGNRSVPGWNILEVTGGEHFAGGGGVRPNGLNMPNSAGNFDNSQYLFYLACNQGPPLGYASTITFRDASFHNCLGGGIEVLSGSHVTFDGVGFYDVYTQGPLNRNITSSLIKVGTYPSGMASRGIEFRGVTRSQGGLTTGSGPSDIEVSSDTQEVLVHGWSWTGWQATNVQGQINLNGALHCVLIAIDAGTTVLNPAADPITISAGAVTLGGVPLATVPVQSASAAATGNSGTITTAGVGVARVNPGGNVTRSLLQAGTYAGQQVIVVNESAYTLTFAAAGTSNVADGTADVIAVITGRTFTWDTSTTRWYR